jgi:hypothetical protein
MAAPVIVVLNDDLASRVAAHLQRLGWEVTTEEAREALDAAARFEDATPQPDLFGGS